MVLSRVVLETIDLVRSNGLGYSFPGWEEMIKEAKKNPRRLAQLISDNYGVPIHEKDVREYIRINRIKF